MGPRHSLERTAYFLVEGLFAVNTRRPEEPMDLFGPYRLEGLLGQGGMGEVYRAYDTRRERVVALKRMRAELAIDDGYQERFRRECTYAARLSSPHVVPIHDFGELDGRLYLDMRLVEGVDLRKLLAGAGPLSPQRAVRIISHVADALDCAHDAGLIHRDVKPSNILVAGTGSREFSYLTDFGIVRTATGNDSSITATGKAIGTLTYMAPELFTGEAHDKRIDIYALGCLLHEALTGSVPFAGEGAVLMYRHLNDPPPRPSTARPELGEHFDDVVARAMAKTPGARFPSAGALAEAADHALATQSTPTSKVPATPETRPPETSDGATSTLTKETLGPPTRVFKKLQAARPRGLRAKLLTITTTLAAVAAIAVGALLYPSNTLAPRKIARPSQTEPIRQSPAGPTLSGPWTRISVTIPSGWHEVPNVGHPYVPEMVYPATCDGAVPGCSAGLARIVTSHGWKDLDDAIQAIDDIARQDPQVLSWVDIDKQSIKIGAGNYDADRARYKFRNPYANHIGETVAMITGLPDWTGRPEISAIIIWLHADPPGALNVTLMDQIVESVHKQDMPLDNPYSNWFNNGGKKRLNAIITDGYKVALTFGRNDRIAGQSACQKLQGDVASAQAYPPFPDGEGETHWGAYLGHLAQAASACVSGVAQSDDSQIEVATTETKNADEEIKEFNGHLRQLPG